MKIAETEIEQNNFEEEVCPSEHKIHVEKKYGIINDFIINKILEEEQKLNNNYNFDVVEQLKHDKNRTINRRKKNIKICQLLCEKIKDNQFTPKDRDSKDLMIKIHKYLERHGVLDGPCTIQMIIQEISSDSPFGLFLATIFAKEATKQTMYQNRFFEEMSLKIEEINDEENMNNKIYFKNLQLNKTDDQSKKLFLHTDGEVCRNRESNDKSDIDCAVYIYKGYKYIENNSEIAFLIAHKKIGGTGHNEKRQLQEMKTFIDNFSKNCNSNEYGIVAIEGTYITNKIMSELTNRAKLRRIQVFYASDIENIMKFITNNM